MRRVILAAVLVGLSVGGAVAATRAPVPVPVPVPVPGRTFTGTVILVSKQSKNAAYAHFEARYAENPYQSLQGGIVFFVTECDMDVGCFTPVVTFANEVSFIAHSNKFYYVEADVMGAHGFAYFSRR